WSPRSTSTSGTGSGGPAGWPAGTTTRRRGRPPTRRRPWSDRDRSTAHRVGRGNTPAHARLALDVMTDAPTPQQVRRALARAERGAALDVAEAAALLAAT